MGRTSRCFRNLFTKSTTQINNHSTDNYKPKWFTTLLKSCKDINRTRAATATANSVVSVVNSSKSNNRVDIEFQSASSDGYAVVSDHNSQSIKAVEVVQVVNRSGCRLDFDPSRRAAVVIQSVFRGYLARKALRALRALVRLQALVRGYIVRKQAVDQVRRMQALIRAQARARAIRAPVPTSSYSSSRTSHSCILDPLTPDYNEYFESEVRSSGHDDLKNQLLHRNSSKSNRNSLPDQIKLGYNGASSRRFDNINKTLEAEISAKAYNSTKDKNLFLHPVENLYFQYSNEIDRYSFYTADDIIPPSHTGSFRSTSAKREGHNVSTNSDSYFDDQPNYMANTKSSKAKMRSLSAPRQRTQLDRSVSQKCYSSVHDYGSRRLSASGVS